MKIKKVAFGILCAVLVLGLVSTGLAFSAVSKPSIKIGILACLTGVCSQDGEDVMHGAQMAVAKVNQEGGILGREIELEVQDSREGESAAGVIAAYRNLRTVSGANLLLGPTWTTAGLAIAPVAAKDPVLLVSTSIGDGRFHKFAENIFNSRGTDEVSTRRAAQEARREGYKRVAIFSSQQPWEASQAQFFAEEFVKLGGIVAAKEEPLPSLSELRPEALRIVNSKPDLIFFANLGQMSIANKFVREAGYRGARYAVYVDEQRLSEAGVGLDGTKFFTFQRPEGDFINAYEAKFDRSPSIPAGVSYDTVFFLVEAIKKAGSIEPQEVMAAFSEIRYQGSTGTMDLAATRCSEKKPVGWVVNNQQIVALAD